MSTRNEIKARLGAVGQPLAFAAPVDPKLAGQIPALTKRYDGMVDRLEAQEESIAVMSDQVYRDVGGFEKDIGIGRLSRDSAKMIADSKALVMQARAILKDIEGTGTYVKFPLDTPEKQKAYIDGVQAALAKGSAWSASMKKLQDQMRQIATQAKAKKSRSSRPGAKLRAGILDRIGAAASALTASPADPTSPQYKSQLAAARKEAQSAVANYKFMRDKAKARQDAMDKYVMSAIKVINASTNVQDVAHFTEQVQVAVRALSTMMSSVKTPFARPGAKAKFGIWGDVPSQYRAAVDFIRKQGRPSSAAMNELKKAIKQRLAYAAQARDPSERQMYGDDAGSLENVLEYAQSGDKATLLRATYNMDTAVRDDVPNEMFIWAGGDVNWSHPNVKAMLDRVSRQAGAASPTKRRAMRPGTKAKMAVNRRKVVQDLEYLRDEARRVNDASARMDAENWLKRVRARDLKEQDWLEAEDAVRYISAELHARPGAKAKMAQEVPVNRKFEIRGSTFIAKPKAGKPAGTEYDLFLVRRNGGEVALASLTSLDKAYVQQRAEEAGRHSIKTHGIGGGYAYLSSRPGAKAVMAAPAEKPGRKVMADSDSDPAVSAKIRKLMAEGKPQKQAVAIALDMKRRGEI